MIGKKIDEGMIYPANKIEEGKRLTKDGLTFEGISDYETIRRKKDGTLVPVVISTAPVIIEKKAQGTIALYKDITERKNAEETLQKSQREFASVFRNSPEALVYVDENANIININPRFTELFGYTLEEIKGKNINEGIIHPPRKIEEGKNLDKTASSEGYFNYESIRKKKDGTCFPVSISGSTIIIDGQLKGMIGTYFDITERKKLEEKTQRLAHFDALTGCYNRGYGMGLLGQQIKLAQRKKYPLLLAYVDIDRLKYINDTFGHKEGDMVLKEGAKLFKSTLREIDIICRIGGDEFFLIFPDSSLDDAPLIRERINKNLEKLNQRLNLPYKIDFSIGLSHYSPSHPLSIEELIKIADDNMYIEKKKIKEGK
jgi:diguanylate cyclase (GGDEF)-like protein/PAS domain S-box-containing protein